ncbi:helix-turn-helix domain-containing protein [Polycladidibacter hongkongensis]|uniref:helix-turn-helix domain-containing protein n=1 Tax=Polycladidibacter hongkongensis TaxID=1647556 RepID=UPI00082CDE14|nr:helix-turn-helix transcriptional regulator [Pseudovibrio hongkongensis]
MANDLSLGQRLALAREPRSRRSTALLFNVAESTLANYEQDKRQPPADLLAGYAEQFGTDMNWLITGEESSSQIAQGHLNEPVFKLVVEVVLGELKSRKSLNEYPSSQVGGVLASAYHLALSKADPEGNVAKSKLNTLPDVIAFLLD